MTAPLQVLQITDCHLLADASATLLGVDTAATLAAVLRQALAEQRADAIIASGDLTHHGERRAYRRFAAVVLDHFGGPTLMLPGNHDLGAALADVLGGTAALGLGRWEILAFDSHGDHQAEARLEPAARHALAARIRASRASWLLLTCHHPPLPVGCPWLDKDCIPEGAELLDSFAAAGTAAGASAVVRGLVFGHIHQEMHTDHDSLAVLGTPSTCFQFEPASPRFAIDRDETTGRPGYRWIELHDDGTLRTRVGRLRGEPLNIDLQDRS